MASGLYGIVHSNRADKQHWTKNCFNSSFPAALANYMLDKDIPAIYARLEVVDGELKIVCSKISIRDVFRSGSLKPQELEFDFESKFDPYQAYAFDSIDGIDLVIKDLNGNFLAPVEVKLSVLPTSATACKPEDEWGCEIVVRTATTSYLVFSLWDEVKSNSRHVREIFEDVCSNIGSWTNDYEMSHKTQSLKSAIDVFEKEYLSVQRPLVMQPFWKTLGQSQMLCDDCFDIVIWSNLAFSRLFLETANDRKMSRPMRASARMARCLWELSKSGKIHLNEIYREMAFRQQTDKELAVSGDHWRRYITSNRTLKPAVSKSAIKEIIKPSYIENLRPERRFDQTLYFTVRDEM